MKKNKIVAVLWDDHTYFDRHRMTDNPDEEVVPVLSIGLIYKKTKKSLVLVNCIERYTERDDACYTIILRSTILSIKEYGEIEIARLR